MKPVATSLTEVDNLPGQEEVKFSISSANSAWVMRSMADLYSNRELACVREYSTNAYDSNKEKAIRDNHDIKPIEVTLPSAMNPYFSVQDFGVGMSETELKEIYTQFGESTKRDSDEYNGMLGFGSKSAIAYTNTFTVTSVKNGRKTVGLITRREDAMGGYLVTLKIVLTTATSEPSGVNIQIPVHNWREFEQKATDFYRFWKPGQVLVNGREPKWAVGEKIADDLYMYPNAGTSYVVMGNVPYRIENPDALFPRGMNRISFVAYVPLGDVEFTPSREDLKYSEHTKKNLHAIINNFISTAVDTAKKEIAEAKTHAEAYLAWSKWSNVIGRSQVDDLTFKGDKLVDSFKINGSRVDIQAHRYGTWTINNWNVSDVKNALFVTGFDINLATPHKKKVKDWINLKSKTFRYVIFTAEATVDSPWVDPSHVVTWETIKKEAPKAPKKPRAVNPAWGRKAGTFDLISRTGREVEKDVPSTKALYYVMVKEYNVQRELGKVLAEFDMDHQVVLLPANRKDKFLRFYPHAKPIMPELTSKVNKDGNALLTPDAELYLSTEHNERNIIAKLEESKFDDPVVKALIRIFKVPEREHLKEYSRHMRLAHVLGINDFKKHKYQNYWECKATPATSRYPLLGNFNTYDVTDAKNKHIYFYCNSLHNARANGKII